MEIPWEPTIAEVKAGLPVQYVLHRAGVLLNEFGSANCPFHDDSNPSLDTFPPNRWACAPCGKGGDVLDLLSAFSPGMKFPDVMTWAARLLGELKRDGWAGSVEQVEKPLFDVAAGSAVVAQAYNDFACKSTVQLLCSAKGWPFDAGYLNREWGVGDSGTEVVIPYWSSDGTLRTYRTRTLESKPKSAHGRLVAPTFYGEWRLRPESRFVVLCEGESDTWTAAWTYRLVTDVAALGIPGAGTPPFGAELLKGRNVIIAFDGDAAGFQAGSKWAAYLNGAGVNVGLVTLPDGRDLASYSCEEIVRLVSWGNG